jgi:hypothetical protein
LRDRPRQRGGGSSAPVITIPDAARGHTLRSEPSTATIEPSAYDAVDEVYVDDLTAMPTRIELFAQHDLLKADSELIS